MQVGVPFVRCAPALLQPHQQDRGVASSLAIWFLIGLVRYYICSWLAKKAGHMDDWTTKYVYTFLRLPAQDVEPKRARARMTLKHCKSSQWARPARARVSA